MATEPTLVWFRNDLRLDDNPALRAAVDRKGPVVPVFVWDPDGEEPWAPGGAGKWWLHHSLRRLAESLENRGSRLIVRHGESEAALRELARETGAGAIFWNRRYEPSVVERDRRIKDRLRDEGIEARSFNGSLLFEPWEVSTRQGGPYKVFTPFHRACLAMPDPDPPADAPRELGAPRSWPSSPAIEALGLEPRIDWAAGIRARWSPGERGAHDALTRFLDRSVTEYAERRDRPDVEGTACLSPHLHFGEIGPRTAWHAARALADLRPDEREARGAEQWTRQLVWREFAHHLLYHFPHTTDAPLRDEFSAFPWREDAEALAAWHRGRTGYPIVDAGMRQLWRTGWMHNRVRMIVASFLVKDLLMPWQEGARWFWDTLVDADLANNTLGWQWTAGCGADAAPYFRIFNPVTQGKRHDPAGHYVREFVPELAGLPDRYVHEPWSAPGDVLESAGVTLGRDYPEPIVDHGEARERALSAYDSIR